MPPFPFAKVAVDLSGPYPTSFSGNKYIISFIDIYSGYPEGFPVPDKSAANIVQLLMDEIIPRHSCPLTLLSDNGSENCNNMVGETEMKINHVTTSFYSPGSNGKVERLNRFMHDILAKKIKDDPSTWDVYLNKTLAAIMCNKNKHEQDTSSDEDDIPLKELKKRINIRNKSLNSTEVLSSETDEDDEIPLSKLKRTLKSDARDESDVTDNLSDRENMSVNSVNVKSVCKQSRNNDQQIIDILSVISQCLKSILVKK
ncbi:unnamed protein product [Mytilus coruscus]|uniref:Integrase catalytic domain-containing protein n=1 Tax=Mytilus coruscus TaxID=42192 RepID=A0A6J8DV12_MYTCO|nr:unnamed protein product [Mytilus coruscus]